MATPSAINNVIVFTPADTYLAGTYEVQGFVVNSSSADWSVNLKDKDGLTVFAASGSVASSLSFPLSSSILITNPSVTLFTKVSDLLLYQP